MRRRLALPLIAVVMLAVAGCGSVGTHGQPVHYAAVTFTGSQTVSLDSYAGQPVILTSFASWCAECVGELPGLERYYRSHPHPQIIAVDLDGPSGRRGAQALVSRNRLSMPIWVDAGQRYISAFSAPGTPTTVLLDRHHHVAKIWFGPVDFASASFATAVAGVNR